MAGRPLRCLGNKGDCGEPGWGDHYGNLERRRLPWRRLPPEQVGGAWVGGAWLEGQPAAVPCPGLMPPEYSRLKKFLRERKGTLTKAGSLEVDNFRLGMIMERAFKYFPAVITRYQTNYWCLQPAACGPGGCGVGTEGTGRCRQRPGRLPRRVTQHPQLSSPFRRLMARTWD